MRLPLLFLTVFLFVPASFAQLSLGVDTTNFDHSIRPQDDLYQFVNGTWEARTAIPADRPRYGAFDELRQAADVDVRTIIEEVAGANVVDPDARKIRDLYASYIDSTRAEALGMQPVQYDLDRIDAIASYENLARYFGRNGWEYGPMPLSWYVWVDGRDSDTYIVTVNQSGLGLPDKSYYEEESFADARAAYLAYIEQLYDLADWEGGADAAQTVLDLETQLAAEQWTNVQNRDPEVTYNKRALADLAAEHPNLHLDLLFAEAEIDRLDSLIVSQPPYLAALNSLVTDVALEDWKTWLRARTLSTLAPYLSKPFVDAQFGFYGQTLNGQEADQPRWRKAVTAVNGTLGEAVGRIYVDRHFPPEAKARMDGLIRNLQRAMRASITELDWMGDQTKAEALRKLDAYVFKIGYPDKWTNYSALEIRPDDLVGNLRRASRFEYEDMIDNQGAPVDRGYWGLTPQTVNAYYNPYFNEIVFPAAILQPPFFNFEADAAVNYGAIGAVIGHEFSHGFDDSGSQYDADGNLRNWWTDSDREEFERRADLMVAQYDAYAPFEDENINGRLTLGENIADHAGLTMAYRAYRLSLDENGDGVVSPSEEPPVIDGFTGDQRFFLGWAQVWRIKHREAYLRQLLKVDSHSPGQYRVIGIVPHLPAFYDAFDVNDGDALYLDPDDRIVIW